MRPASAFEPGMARRWRYLPRDRDATERAVMGLASPPMGLASPPSRPRLTPRRTRRGRRVRGGRGATSRRGEKPKHSHPAGREVAFSRRPRNFQIFSRRLQRLSGWYRWEETTRRLGRPISNRLSRGLSPRLGAHCADRRARERPARLESFASRWTHGTSRARPLDGALCERGRPTVATARSALFRSSPRSTAPVA